MMRRPIALLVAFALVACLSLCSRVSAETVIKFDLAGINTGPDVSFLSGSFGTNDDGNTDPNVPGDQTTNVSFLGFLSGIPSIPMGASLTLSGVTAVNAAGQLGNLISQDTTGGMFSLYDTVANNGALLLSGTIDSGVIVGSSTSSTAAFLSNSPVMYTGGSLLPLLDPNSGALSLSLNDVRTGTEIGLRVNGGVLQNFTATAVGQLEASAVPEPSVLGMAAIGALALIRHRRHRKNKSKAA